MEDELMTYAEVGKMTGIKLGTLYAKVKDKKIPHVRLGKRMVRFRRAEIQQWLKAHSVAAAHEVLP
jgi:excisionase family DNA binding protein